MADLNERFQTWRQGAEAEVPAGDIGDVLRRAARWRRRQTGAGLAVTAAAAAVAIGVAAGAGVWARPVAPASGPARQHSTFANPLTLVGSWRVIAPGVRNVLVRFDGELTVREPCGVTFGAWDADPYGLFTASLFGGARACLHELTPPWLSHVARFRDAHADRLLLNSAGDVVARLVPVTGRVSFGGLPIPLGAQGRSRLLAGRPLPAGLIPATAESLVGRWVPPGFRHSTSSHQPYLDFLADGTWHGSDGCNSTSGRWALGPAGALVSTSGPTGLIACGWAGAPTIYWLPRAARASVAGSALTLVNAEGHVVGRLIRAG
jgi:META domain